ncbi:eukaryotic translation initiation factor 3 subunit A [Myxocyprinus asiaticus]|uniref:eukaryotic translation initiation factor 3 subunit A n=1 Tax=Myxocyprinus asiaticus TaxID=70543 RepID=UPI0022213A21|nr:eukaryotic translation initiation factor 3 subunit A [Myxocyprinus asiaticus]
MRLVHSPLYDAKDRRRKHNAKQKQKTKMESEEVFKWTDANTTDLIVWRVSNNSLFTGKRNAAIKAFELYVKEKQLQGKVTPAWVRKKWENLKQKYKDLKSLSIVGGDTAIATWKWYAIMDGALSSEIPFSPLITPVHGSSSAQDAPPIKQRKEEDWMKALREMERRQEERERRSAEREDERDRRAAAREEERDRRAAERETERDRRATEREDEREREALEREMRREREMFAREERWEKEMLAREERQEREHREREERREREAAAREERLFKLLETFLANK